MKENIPVFPVVRLSCSGWLNSNGRNCLMGKGIVKVGCPWSAESLESEMRGKGNSVDTVVSAKRKTTLKKAQKVPGACQEPNWHDRQ